MDGEIDSETLEAQLEDEDGPVVVDIREPLEFEMERIPGSVNIPFSELPREVDRLAGEDHVVTVCPHGQASVQAARLITSYEGFDGHVESLECGLTGWKGPLESGAEGGSGVEGDGVEKTERNEKTEESSDEVADESEVPF